MTSICTPCGDFKSLIVHFFLGPIHKIEGSLSLARREALKGLWNDSKQVVRATRSICSRLTVLSTKYVEQLPLSTNASDYVHNPWAETEGATGSLSDELTQAGVCDCKEHW